MECLKIQKPEYLENETYFFYEIKKFLTCASDDTFLEVMVFSWGNLKGYIEGLVVVTQHVVLTTTLSRLFYLFWVLIIVFNGCSLVQLKK